MKIKKENLIKGIIFEVVMWLCIGGILILLNDIIWYGNLIGKFNYKFREMLAFSSAAVCGLAIGITGAKVILGDWSLKMRHRKMKLSTWPKQTRLVIVWANDNLILQSNC